ncbi:tumor necrosis factor receptor superfamily member 4 [Lampris incognitus]|uniref:tumor necrosis factor receptor superfamily member 4 n=1 Tax=Lampris incognitus TaxID=2546036 RepID=UPI0024B618CB|nr:tumor necrosis factor receptor superfamily member 4 [Lampris incognitus]
MLLALACAIILTLVHPSGAYQKCAEGQVKNGGRCEDCPDGKYASEPDSTICEMCTRCFKKSGSEYETHCSKTSDAKCRCRKGFVRRESNSATCKCDIGSGLDNTGALPECRECEDGFFSDKKDSPCIPWKKCETSGVKVKGTKTSDAICNDKRDRTTTTARPPSNNDNPSLPTGHHMSHPPGMESQTPGSPRHGTTAKAGTTKDAGQSVRPKSGNKIELILILTFGIVGVIILTYVTCKLNTLPCMRSYCWPGVKLNNSVCRRPVEESGDSSLSSPLQVGL